MIRKLLPVLVVAFLATACFEADFAIDVSEDGSGTFDTELLVDAQALETAFGGLSASMGTDEELDACGQLSQPNSIAPGGTAEPAVRDDLCGFRSSEPFASPAELVSVLDGTFSDDTGVPDVEEVTLEPTAGGGWRFELLLPSAGIMEGMTEQMAATLGFDRAVMAFRVRLPGRIVEHNGDRIEDGFVVWDLDLNALPTEPLVATSEPGDPVDDSVGAGATGAGAGDEGGNAVQFVILAVVVLAAVGGGVVLVRRRRAPSGG